MITNTGNVPLLETTVSDAKLGLTRNLGALLPDASTLVTGVLGALTENDLPGPITNTASVTATIVRASGGVIAPMTVTNIVTITIYPNLALTTTTGPEPGDHR